MSWLMVATVAYFILAIVFLTDKYLLTDKIPDPKVYAFYSGLSGVLLAALIPFIDFEIPSLVYIGIAFLSGISFFVALLLFYKSLKVFEVSRVVPTVGAMIPIFSLILAYIFSGGQETLKSFEIPAFLVLVAGSFLINYERKNTIFWSSTVFSLLTSIFFSLHFILAKYVYMVHSFWSGIIWINFGGFLMAILIFFISKSVRSEILVRRSTFKKETAMIFVISKVFAAAGGLLQNLAIFLAPTLTAVAIVNGLQGIQYAFLLLFTIFLSVKFPKIIKEEISKGTIIKKSIAIVLILAGMMFIAFSGL